MYLERKILLTLILLGLFLHKGYAQTASISGVINSYAQIEAILQAENKRDSLLVRNINLDEFESGDTVMVHVVLGAEIKHLSEGDEGDIGTSRRAGKYAFLIINNIIAGPSDTIVVLNTTMAPEIIPLVPGNIAQLIKVPSYSEAVVTEEVTAPAWDGSTGGVVAMFVNRSLKLNADINVTGLGFRGANQDGPDDPYEGTCSNIDTVLYGGLFYPMSPVLAGRKGEGITDSSFDLLRGKGKNINGGGGGNGRLSGGGGGGNVSAGGQGGDESEECIPMIPNQGGFGGARLGDGSFYLNSFQSTFPFLVNRISFGGGGGSGVRVNGIESSAGAPGGGLVVIVADTIDGGGNGVIRADGASVTDVVEGAGGGGGAGGGIILDVSGYKNDPTLSAIGGDGGDTQWGTKTGPGGGGGGGIYWLSGKNRQLVNDLYEPGRSGRLVPASGLYGATDGNYPFFKDDLEVPLRGFLFNSVPREFKVCSDQVPDTIRASSPKGGSGEYTYQWIDSSSTQDFWRPIDPEQRIHPFIFQLHFQIPPTSGGS